MIISEVAERIEGKVLCCKEKVSKVVDYAFSSDLMSDVLTVKKENVLLITGLANIQVIRTCEMSEINCIVFARGKRINNDMLSLAIENEIVIIESPYSIYRISGELYRAGIKPIY